MSAIAKALHNLIRFTTTDQWYYFIILLMSMVSALTLYLDFSMAQLLFIVAMSVSLGFVLVTFANIFRRCAPVRLAFLILFVVALNLMCITDTFLLIKFDKTFDNDIFFVISNTNENESTGFLKTFVDWQIALKVIGVLLMFNGLSLILSRIMAMRTRRRKKRCVISVALSFLILVSIIGFRLTGFTNIQISGLNVLFEYMHPIVYRHNGFFETQKILENCRNVAGKVESNPSDSTIYVVVVGESHNKSHNSLYGYRLNTMPRMKERMDSGQLVVFDKCLARYGVTHKALKTILSLSNDLTDIEEFALFPVIFHEARYRTECYDNQFIIKSRLHIVNDPDISALSYDYRTEDIKKYDGDMIDGLLPPKPHSMVLINLNGQHSAYCDRIPDTFQCSFSLEDYYDVEDYKRKVFCDYDNATSYVDSVLELIIEHYKDYSTCLIYLSDHGEDLWDYGSLGHGHGLECGKNQRQYITFFVWGSHTFRNTDKWNDIVGASDKLITSSDISHVLLDLAGIKFIQLDPTRSFVNNKYVESNYSAIPPRPNQQ